MAAVVVAVALATAAAWRGFPSLGSDRQPRIAIAPLSDRTNDPSLASLGAMASDWLEKGLVDFPNATVAEMPGAQRGRADDQWRGIALGTGASMLVTGAYYRLGDSIRLQARVVDVRSGDLVGVTPSISTLAADPTRGINALRQSVLGILATRMDRRLAPYAARSSQPPSYDSYRAYIRGVELFTAGNWTEAAPQLEAVFAKDTVVARALILAGIARLNLGQWIQADSIVQRLERSRSKLGDADQAFLDWEMAHVRGDPGAALSAIRRADSLAPGTMWSFQHGLEAHDAHRPHEALVALQHVDTSSSGDARVFTNYWFQLTLAYHQLGDLDAEIRACNAARRILPNSNSPLVWLGRAYAARGDSAAVANLADTISERALLDPGAPTRLAELAAWAAWEHRPQLARSVAARAVPLAQSRLSRSRTDVDRLLLGRARELAGGYDEARVVFDSVLKSDSTSLDALGYAGVNAADRGDARLARSMLAAVLALREPYLFGDRFRWAARITARLGDRAQAVEFLKQADAAGRGRVGLAAGDAFLPNLHGYPAFEQYMAPRG